MLFIGEATVKTHLLHAFAKLGVDDRTAAVTTAIACGWLRRLEPADVLAAHVGSRQQPGFSPFMPP